MIEAELRDGPAIEAEQLRVLAEAAGKEAVEPILEAFWQSNDELYDQLGAAFSGGDMAVVASVAHALKGSSANLGAARMAETARAVETAAKANDAQTAREAHDRLPEDVAVTRAAFAQLMTSIG